MKKFRIQDLQILEIVPTSPMFLCNGVGEIILSSPHANENVEEVNPETGEYRIVLQGTLDREETPFDKG